MRARRILLSSTLACAACAVLALPVQSTTPTHLWSQRFGNTGFDEGRCVAVDGVGNIIVVGFFDGVVDFGGGALTSSGQEDIFVAKYDPSGTHLWSNRFGSTGQDQGSSVAVDASDNIIVTGFFQGTVDFGGGNLTAGGLSDGFIAKYDANGAHLWSKQIGGEDSDVGLAVAIDGSGNVFASGYFEGTVDFGGGNVTSAGEGDLYLAKYDASGAHLWSHRYGDTSHDSGYSLAVDGSGNVIATGFFEGTVDFGGGSVTSAGGRDTVVAKYDAGGAHLWSQRFGGASDDEGRSVAVDGSGNLFLTGYFSSTADFGGGSVTAASAEDIFLAKYNAAGTHLWSQQFGNGTGGDDVGQSVAVDGAGNVSLTGYFVHTLDLGGGGITGTAGSNIFVAKYNTAGAYLWSHGSGVVSLNFGNSVAVDGSGRTVATGAFEWQTDMGGGLMMSAGFSDVFLARFADSPVTTGVGVMPGIDALSVSAYPNPFNPSTTIRFSIPLRARVNVSLYEVGGTFVTTLIDEERPAGVQTVRWNGAGDSGGAVSSGVYFVRVRSGSSTQTAKIVLLK